MTDAEIAALERSLLDAARHGGCDGPVFLSMGCDSEQGRAAPLPSRDPWFSVLHRYGSPGWLHAVSKDPNLVRVPSEDWPSCDRSLFRAGAAAKGIANPEVR